MKFYDAYTGRTVGEDTALSRVEAYTVAREVTADRLDYAEYRLDSAVGSRSYNYWTREVGRTLNELNKIDAALDGFNTQLGEVYGEESEDIEDVADIDLSGEFDFGGPDWGEDGDDWLDVEAYEWEFGCDYSGEDD